MAKQTAFGVKIDVSEVEDFAAKLGGMSPASIGALLVGAINDATDSAYELARKTMLGGINLTDTYVRSRMQVEHATVGKPEATITAFGDKAHLTGLSHYGAMMQTRAVQHPGRSRGDPARGIPPGQKSAGVSVEVIKGKRESFSHGFFMPGKIDSEGNPLVFARKKGTNKIVSRRGPAVYMLFRVAAGAVEDQVYGDLQQRVVAEAERQFQKEFQ